MLLKFCLTIFLLFLNLFIHIFNRWRQISILLSYLNIFKGFFFIFWNSFFISLIFDYFGFFALNIFLLVILLKWKNFNFLYFQVFFYYFFLLLFYYLLQYYYIFKWICHFFILWCMINLNIFFIFKNFILCSCLFNLFFLK